MSVVNYLEDKKDFLEEIDLLDFLDLNKLSDEIKENINEFKNHTALNNIEDPIIIMAKYPVSSSYHQYVSSHSNLVLYKYINYSNKQDYMLFDKETKTIVLNVSNLYYSLTRLIYQMRLKKTDLKDLIVDKIGDYKVLQLEDIRNDLDKFIQNKNNELIKDNYDLLFELGKKELDDKDIIKDSERKIKVNYVLSKNSQKENVNFLTSCSNSILYNKNSDYKIYHFIALYLRDKSYLSQVIDTQFNELISDNSYDFRYYCKAFYINEVENETMLNLKSFMENDLELNMYKEIVNAIRLGGKTITINDTKYDNSIDTDYTFSEIKVGSYKTGHIALKDIETISFSRKVLFDKKEYMDKYLKAI